MYLVETCSKNILTETSCHDNYQSVFYFQQGFIFITLFVLVENLTCWEFWNNELAVALVIVLTS